MMKYGLAFHVHHDKLVEYCYDYNKRVKYIKRYKPLVERGLRLRLLQIIPKDKLPQNGLEAYDKAQEASYKAWEAYLKAWEAYYKAGEAYCKAREAYDKTREAYCKAWEAYLKAWEACDKAWEAYHKTNQSELDKLHQELCPDCPFDGETIFTREV